MRLIDADALYVDYLWPSTSTMTPVYRYFSKAQIDNAPTIDAVPVVRCAECAVPHNRWTGCPKLNGSVTFPDFYCADGKRKDGD